MNGYELSRIWFDWCFDNASKIRPIHTALFFFIIEHNNRLGWKKEFGLPRQMAMDAIGVKNNRTFTSAFDDLEKWGFITVFERSKNQYSANIISLYGYVENTPATTKAYDKALQKHSHKQSAGIAPIDKPLTNKQINNEQGKNLTPFELIEKEKPSALEVWFSQNLKNINDFDSLVHGFNNTAMIEILSDKSKLEFNANSLFYRFSNYARAWISNQKPKENKPTTKQEYEQSLKSKIKF